ncbi:putative protein tyrosine phosphatase [Cavenderia fasciculata]|uniref:protein-tyrosine-phosphatase n=1 Tax=Cavenderia fasciculata TaxID=261658 RepID=F4QF65_CACFS|nr:putative protein tyrosine phosphatase [Cavenderia fasciculata]EGG14219.1 putative protein tyrosine phosphatase [Cavenderia fasciculata]|eukprot:XP_004350927.1 putative protein tyrosine phosphatase [Cavenderia fasciculata]
MYRSSWKSIVRVITRNMKRFGFGMSLFSDLFCVKPSVVEQSQVQVQVQPQQEQSQQQQQQQSKPILKRKKKEEDDDKQQQPLPQLIESPDLKEEQQQQQQDDNVVIVEEEEKEKEIEMVVSLSPARTPIKQQKQDHDGRGIRNNAIIPSPVSTNDNIRSSRPTTPIKFDLNDSVQEEESGGSSGTGDSSAILDASQDDINYSLPRVDSSALLSSLFSLHLGSPLKRSQRMVDIYPLPPLTPSTSTIINNNINNENKANNIIVANQTTTTTIVVEQPPPTTNNQLNMVPDKLPVEIAQDNNGLGNIVQQDEQQTPNKVDQHIIILDDVQTQPNIQQPQTLQHQQVEIFEVSQRINNNDINTTNNNNINNINNNNNSTTSMDNLVQQKRQTKNLGLSSGLDGAYWSAPIESKRQKKPVQSLFFDYNNDKTTKTAVSTSQTKVVTAIKSTKTTKPTTKKIVGENPLPIVNPVARLGSKKSTTKTKTEKIQRSAKKLNPKDQLQHQQPSSSSSSSSTTTNEVSKGNTNETKKKLQIRITFVPKDPQTPTKTVTRYIETAPPLPNNLFSKDILLDTSIVGTDNQLFKDTLLDTTSTVAAEDLKEGFLAFAGLHSNVKLFVGGKGCLNNKDWLDRENISSFINVTKEITHPKDVETNHFLRISVSDSMDQRISSHFSEAVEFLSQSLGNNKPVLVHCREGRSRSTTIVIAYGIKVLNMPLKQCYEIVAKNVPRININSGFLNQLMEYEYNTRGSNSINFFEKSSRRQAAAQTSTTSSTSTSSTFSSLRTSNK